MRILIFIFILSLPVLCDAGQVYKWRDRDGNVYYSDVEPNNQSTQRKIVKAKDPIPAPLTAKELACERARNNIKTLAESDTVQMDLDKDGKLELLSAEQRAQQMKAMEAAVAANCSP